MFQPTSQKDRPIGFVLWDGQSGIPVESVTLAIRPEELTKQDPSRATDHQSLGGIWTDDFGPGISTITIAGHTGWRKRPQVDNLDGLERFQKLRDIVFSQWHILRREKTDSGQDPDSVELIFSDPMDNIASVVRPAIFQLRRHRYKPLLCQFNIGLTVLRDAAEPGLSEFEIDPIQRMQSNPGLRYQAAKISLSASQARLSELAKTVEAVTGVSASARALMEKSAEVMGAVNAVADEVKGTFDATTAPLLDAALSINRAARNGFQILASPVLVVAHAKGRLMEIASELNNAYCTIWNGFNLNRRYPNFSDLFGASTCSSTGGGRPLSPLAGSNPFLSIFQAKDSPVSVSETARAAMASLINTDPTQANGVIPGDPMQDIADGVTVLS